MGVTNEQEGYKESDVGMWGGFEEGRTMGEGGDGENGGGSYMDGGGSGIGKNDLEGRMDDEGKTMGFVGGPGQGHNADIPIDPQLQPNGAHDQGNLIPPHVPEPLHSTSTVKSIQSTLMPAPGNQINQSTASQVPSIPNPSNRDPYSLAAPFQMPPPPPLPAQNRPTPDAPANSGPAKNRTRQSVKAEAAPAASGPVYTEVPPTTTQTSNAPMPKKRGRPLGSKNKPKN
ncbi:hypothetical protein FRC08_012246 [Ceratobasidium sp. 394]|nr:hypothetical protein FRC08_012246 [Ceratobasidium sp. 394]